MSVTETKRRTSIPERIPGLRQIALDAEARNLGTNVEQKMRIILGQEGYSVIFQDQFGVRRESEVFLRNKQEFFKVSITELREKDRDETALEITNHGELDLRKLTFLKYRYRFSNSPRIWRVRYFQEPIKTQSHMPIRNGLELMKEVLASDVDHYVTQKEYYLLDDELRKSYSPATLGWNKYLGVPADDFAFIPITTPNPY